MAEPLGSEGNPEALRTEAAELAKSVRQLFLLLVGAGAFMFVTLNISDAKLVTGETTFTVPVIDAESTVSALIVFGPVVITGILFYAHFSVGRLEALVRQDVYAPKIYFFTIGTPAARIFSDVVFYAYVPTISAWFVLRTIFRPEAPRLLLLLAAALLGCSLLLMWRAWLGRERIRIYAAAAYLALAAALVVWGAVAYWREGRSAFQHVIANIAPRLDLEDAKLAQLAGEITLVGFNFDDVCFRNADLSGLNLAGASFVGADLTGAKLNGADLTGANFANAHMSRLEAVGARFDSARLEEAELGGSDLREAVFRNAIAPGADFSQAQIGGAAFAGATLPEANFSEVNRSKVNRSEEAPKSIFNRAKAERASFCNADLRESQFLTAKLQGARFDRADLSEAGFGGADLSGADLRHAEREGTDFTKAIMPKAIDGPEQPCQAGGILEMAARPSPCP